MLRLPSDPPALPQTDPGRFKKDYCESFNSKLRDELLNGEMFYNLAEARIVIECWRQHYNI